MSRLPIPNIINTIKTKLGFDRALTASGEDVVDAVNKQAQQISGLDTALSGGSVISNVDLNDYKTTGAWLVSNINTITNSPAYTATYGTLYVRKNGAYVTQIFITENGSASRQSYNSGTAWGKWTAFGSRPLQSGLAIVSNNDSHAAITKGQFVYIKNHASLAEGLYKANAAIDTNGALSGNVTAASGGLNALSSAIDSLSGNIAIRRISSATDLDTLRPVDVGYTTEYVCARADMASNRPAGPSANFPFRLFVYYINEYIGQLYISYSKDGEILVFMRQQYYESKEAKPFGPWTKCIDTLNSNSSYAVLELSAEFSGDLKIIRCGKQRVLFGEIKPPSVGTNMVAATLESADRPTMNVYASCSAFGLSIQSEIKLTSDGKLQFNVPQNGNENFLRFNFTYYVS